MGHFYEQDGTPRYEVMGKTTGRMRDATIKDCRENGWVPSVNEVINIIAKPQLTEWQIQQGILAALTTSRKDDEGDKAFLARITTDSKEQAKKAAEKGALIHDAIDDSFSGRPVPAEFQKHVDGVREKLHELFPLVTDWISERPFAHWMGFGGRVDLRSPSTGIIVDYKGKDGDFSDGKKLAYDQFIQLAGYQGGNGHIPGCNVGANIFFSRTHPGATEAHVWTREDMLHGWDIFRAALQLWKVKNKYDGAFTPGFMHKGSIVDTLA